MDLISAAIAIVIVGTLLLGGVLVHEGDKVKKCQMIIEKNKRR